MLSSISADIAQVLFAAFIAAIVLPLDSGKIFVVLLEIVSSLVFWGLALLFAEKGKL